MTQSPVKTLSGAAIAGLCIAMSTAPIAEASPRFSVTNNADAKINVYIYTGDDSVCTWEEKLKSVSKGETDSYGCTGNGKGQCKVRFYAHGDEICKSARDTCMDNAIKVKGGKSITITKDGEKYSCALS